MFLGIFVFFLVCVSNTYNCKSCSPPHLILQYAERYKEKGSRPFIKQRINLFLGRNVALKQSTEQSSNFPFWPKESGASVAVDGRTGVSEDVKSTCTHTSNQGSRGWWRLMFSQPVDVTWFHIYNRDGKVFT